MIIPQDEHLSQIERLVRVMDDAASALERAGMTVDDLPAGLDEARDEVVTEHYGAKFMDEIDALGTEQNAGGNRR
ncbi:MAG TPA: hypothetical protein VNL71_22045 [Chloroflexota bacterium]|nr:hypothetical protein [Chloroflexota bacterium]